MAGLPTSLFLQTIRSWRETRHTGELLTMFRRGVRQFATTALRSAEASTPYHTRVSKAQGFVNGLTEGRACVFAMDTA